MCVSNFVEVKACAIGSPNGHWSFFGLGTEEQLRGTLSYKPEGLWNRSAEMIMLRLRDSQHPVFRATSAMDRGSKKIKEEWYRFITTVTCRPQSFYFVPSFPSTSSVSTEPSTKKPVANMDEQLDS